MECHLVWVECPLFNCDVTSGAGNC